MRLDCKRLLISLRWLQVFIQEGEFPLVRIFAMVTLLEAVALIRVGVIVVGFARCFQGGD
jgi:hypothetical protein